MAMVMMLLSLAQRCKQEVPQIARKNLPVTTTRFKSDQEQEVKLD